MATWALTSVSPSALLCMRTYDLTACAAAVGNGRLRPALIRSLTFASSIRPYNLCARHCLFLSVADMARRRRAIQMVIIFDTGCLS